MDMHSKNELTETVAPRYRQASKAEKVVILNEYCLNTGYNRKYAIRKLSAELLYPYKVRKRSKRTRRKKSRYTIIKGLLIKFWEVTDYACGVRLQAALPELIDKAFQFNELHISAEEHKLLTQISPASIDRLLADAIRLRRRKMDSQTQAAYLKSIIPLACDTDKVNKPGTLETDLVAHCGGNAMGPFINTLSTTDFVTTWQESEAIMGKSQQVVKRGLLNIAARLPFPLLGLDFDNGSEFINQAIWELGQEMKITITRSRPYKKNDNAHIEQKNWTNVRKLVGYLRLESKEAQRLLNSLYRNELRLYINFFQPSMKLVSKERIGSKVKKKYDKPKTPYQRVLERDDVAIESKDKLTALYETLNPFELKRRIDHKLGLLVSLAQKGAA